MRDASLIRTGLGLCVGLSLAVGTMALADGMGVSFLDTGAPATDDTGSAPSDVEDTGSAPADDSGSAPVVDTGSAPSDDTGESGDTGEPGDDTGEPSGDDTGEPSGDDTGVNDDTGHTHIGDTGPIGKSAAELAGEKGGCGCASQGQGPDALWWLGVLGLIGLRRRR